MAKEYFVIAHWSTLIENINESPKKFYERIESGITKKELPDITMSESEMKEGGFFSDKRLYFTIERRNYCMDICAAPFGKGFFVSSWLSYNVGGLLNKIFFYLAPIPILGSLIAPLAVDATLYQRDTTDAFLQSVHGSVLEVIDDITKTNGLKVLSESERKPIMSDFYLPKSLNRG
jgi:hypothetical protein